MNGDAPWTRYEVTETIQQHQRISRTEAKHIPSGMPVWIDRLQPYYGDHPDSLKVAREFLTRHCRVSHPALPAPLDAWEYDGALCWVYRAQKGTAVRDLLGEHRPSLAALEPLATDLALGLVALHKAGLHHGSFDVDSLVIAGKRRLVLTRRGIRHHLNDMLNRSTLEDGVTSTLSGGPPDDIAAWGELVGGLMTGEALFGRVLLSARSAGTFDQREAEQTFQRKGIAGRLTEVVLRATKAKSAPEESFPDLERALSVFHEALARDLAAKGRGS